MKNMTIIIMVVAVLVTVCLYYFVENTSIHFMVHLVSVLFALVSSFIAWFRAGEDDEDRIYWLGVWITAMLMGLGMAYMTFGVIYVSASSPNDWSLFAGLFAVITCTIGLGASVMIFQSHISETTSKRENLVIMLVSSVLTMGYLFYLLKYAPKITVILDNMGVPTTMMAPYVINALFLLAITLVSVFNTVAMQAKLWGSDKHSRIDLWLSSSALYLTIPAYLFALITPNIILTVEKGMTAMTVGNYLLIPICIMIGVSGVVRAFTGEIEKNPFEEFTSQHGNRLPENG